MIGLVSVVVVMVTGLAYSQTHGLLGGITISHALGLDAPRSTGGGTNILLIGLDSRKDQDGNDLPEEVLDKLHAGDSSSGGYNTNTLILVHIGADDRVVAFSIPRDDYVAVNGIDGLRPHQDQGGLRADEGADRAGAAATRASPIRPNSRRRAAKPVAKRPCARCAP